MKQKPHIEFVFEPPAWAERAIAGLEEIDRLIRKASAGKLEAPSK